MANVSIEALGPKTSALVDLAAKDEGLVFAESMEDEERIADAIAGRCEDRLRRVAHHRIARRQVDSPHKPSRQGGSRSLSGRDLHEEICRGFLDPKPHRRRGILKSGTGSLFIGLHPFTFLRCS